MPKTCWNAARPVACALPTASPSFSRRAMATSSDSMPDRSKQKTRAKPVRFSDNRFWLADGGSRGRSTGRPEKGPPRRHIAHGMAVIRHHAERGSAVIGREFLVAERAVCFVQRNSNPDVRRQSGLVLLRGSSLRSARCQCRIGELPLLGV